MEQAIKNRDMYRSFEGETFVYILSRHFNFSSRNDPMKSKHVVFLKQFAKGIQKLKLNLCL